MSNEQYEGRRGRQPGAGAGERVIGSLTWQVEQMEPGEILLKAETGESTHRTCRRALVTVTEPEPEREYALSLWHALHHTGTGEGMRLYRIERVK
jgi:hypothetical protein